MKHDTSVKEGTQPDVFIDSPALFRGDFDPMDYIRVTDVTGRAWDTR